MGGLGPGLGAASDFTREFLRSFMQADGHASDRDQRRVAGSEPPRGFSGWVSSHIVAGEHLGVVQSSDLDLKGGVYESATL